MRGRKHKTSSLTRKFIVLAVIAVAGNAFFSPASIFLGVRTSESGVGTRETKEFGRDGFVGGKEEVPGGMEGDGALDGMEDDGALDEEAEEELDAPSVCAAHGAAGELPIT